MNQKLNGWTRPKLLTLAVGIVTALVLMACLALLAPFLSAVTWSVALAVVLHPVYHRLAPQRFPSVSAATGVLVVSLFIIGPAILLGIYLTSQARAGLQFIQRENAVEQWRGMLQQHPKISGWLQWIQDQVDLQGQLQGAAESLGKMLPAFLGGSLWVVVQLLIMLFLLFYFLRDRHSILKWLHDNSPFSNKETNLILYRVRDCFQATVVGNVLTSLLQGTLGGLMMWFLGLPFPILWGAVMALFSLVPTLGAPVVWLPAALMLAAQGDWGKALILTGWGAAVIGTIDNLLYPILVGRKMTVHTVPIFLSYLGGIVLFGFTGLILGPLIVTIGWTLLEIWRQRTAQGRVATDSIAADVGSS
jgi:predicted PurR-regulated permease PerM